MFDKILSAFCVFLMFVAFGMVVFGIYLLITGGDYKADLYSDCLSNVNYDKFICYSMIYGDK